MIILLFLVAAAFSISDVYCDGEYGTKFDNLDLELIMTNERLLKNHFDCLLEDKGCMPETTELKKHLPEIIETCCAKCSEKHKAGKEKLVSFLKEKRPELLKAVLDKYDPDRSRKAKCAEKMKNSGIDVSKV
ncbi:hypothetical protein HHI36_011797 [Cryptolaemus montrouzieri]|uniref:Chemosensory protein n=1 Tax=Cryptolaemus montrouzieri TaxID=559131 RepID=A0ABD2NCT3_9CUCU